MVFMGGEEVTALYLDVNYYYYNFMLVLKSMHHNL
jgi:hypothetical protein